MTDWRGRVAVGAALFGYAADLPSPPWDPRVVPSGLVTAHSIAGWDVRAIQAATPKVYKGTMPQRQSDFDREYQIARQRAEECGMRLPDPGTIRVAANVAGELHRRADTGLAISIDRVRIVDDGGLAIVSRLAGRERSKTREAAIDIHGGSGEGATLCLADFTGDETEFDDVDDPRDASRWARRIAEFLGRESVEGER